MRGSKVRGNDLGEALGCRGVVQRLPGRCASVGKQSQLLLQPTEVELGLQVGVEFDKESICKKLKTQNLFCDSVFWQNVEIIREYVVAFCITASI